MPHCNLMALMTARLWATAHDEPQGYADAEAFLAAVVLIEDSLQAHGGERAGVLTLRRLRRRAQCFGFHLASLDLRQHAAVHDAALAALLADAGWSDASVDALRAIPWVFAWSQNRAGLTAWCDVGTALERALARHGRDALAAMARDWPFINTMIDDIEMVLAKSDLGIFERYSTLAGPLHAQFHPGIAADFERTRATVLAIKGHDDLLADDHRLRQSIRLRNPYVDSITLLQVDLLACSRAAGSPDDARLQSLVATVKGIAAGIRNTG